MPPTGSSEKSMLLSRLIRSNESSIFLNILSYPSLAMWLAGQFFNLSSAEPTVLLSVIKYKVLNYSISHVESYGEHSRRNTSAISHIFSHLCTIKVFLKIFWMFRFVVTDQLMARVFFSYRVLSWKTRNQQFLFLHFRQTLVYNVYRCSIHLLTLMYENYWFIERLVPLFFQLNLMMLISYFCKIHWLNISVNSW